MKKDFKLEKYELDFLIVKCMEEIISIKAYEKKTKNKNRLYLGMIKNLKEKLEKYAKVK